MRLFVVMVMMLGIWSCGSSEQAGSEIEVDSTAQVDPTLDSLNQLIFKNTSDPSLYTSRAKHFRKIGNPSAALSDIKRALRIDTTYGDAYLINGQIMFEMQDFRTSYESYKKCLESNPDHIECLLEAAFIESVLENFPEAIVYINRALKQDSYIPRAYYLKGQVYKQSGDTTLAVSSYQTATELDPEYYDAFVALGLLYAASDNDLAIEYYNTALSIKPNSTESIYDKAIYLQESAYRDTSRYSQAFELYNRILEIDPSNAAACFNQGYIYLEYLSTGNNESYEKAIEWFNKSLELYPLYYQALYNRGLCHESLDLLDRAENDYRKALTIQPDYGPAAIALERVIDSKN